MARFFLILGCMVLATSISLLTLWWFNKLAISVLLTLLLTLICALSVIAFFASAVDKYKATNNKPRIKELTLHRLELLGGWPGSIIAQQLFRHKTSKKSYQGWFYLAATIHLAVFAAIFYACLK